MGEREALPRIGTRLWHLSATLSGVEDRRAEDESTSSRALVGLEVVGVIRAAFLVHGVQGALSKGRTLTGGPLAGQESVGHLPGPTAMTRKQGP